MISDIDSKMGITVYSTTFDGIGGKIRVNDEDFQVSEKISDSSFKSIQNNEGYAVYKLKKKRIDTTHALQDVFKKKGLRLKALGLKDASAITEQFVCSNNKGHVIENFSTSKYDLQHIGFTKKPLSKKDMAANHFKIKITESDGRLNEFHEQNKLLNFYGYQRFGSKRPMTHLVGKAILQKDFSAAVDYVVSFTSTYDSKENTEIRQKLTDRNIYEKYYDEIPPQMDIERIVVKEIIEHGDNEKAIRAIPLQLRRFYIQAYQSYILNKTLSQAFSNGENLFEAQDGDVCYDVHGILGKYVKGLEQHLAIPVVGYSYYKKTRFNYYVTKILDDEEITPRDFYIKEMQEVSNEGGFRQASILCSDYAVHDSTVEFTLSRGSFATVLLREIMKPDNPIDAGF